MTNTENIKNTEKLKRTAHIMLFIASSVIGGCAYFSQPVWAQTQNQDSSKITKEQLDSYYKDLVAAQLAGEKEATIFMDEHTHPDFESVMHVTSKIDGAPEPQKETVVLTKFESLRDIKKAYEMGTIDVIKSGIVSYDIAKDGRSAKVKDRTYTMASFPLNTEGGKTQTFNLRQYIDCDNFYVLSDKDVIQLKSGTCEVQGQMSKAQEL